MSSHNNEWKNEYLSFKKGQGPTNNRNLYIQSVINHYGSDFAKAFDKNVYELIIEDDSFFANISSVDAAEILKKTELIRRGKPAIVLREAFKSSAKYVFDDAREVRPKYADNSLKGLYGLSKEFREMD